MAKRKDVMADIVDRMMAYNEIEEWIKDELENPQSPNFDLTFAFHCRCLLRKHSGLFFK